MTYSLAFALGAVLPKTVSEHREMLRSGRYFRIRVSGMGGLALFWAMQPGLALS